MPQKVLLDDPFVDIEANDFSALIKQVELTLDRVELNATAGGDKTQISQPGLKIVGFRITAFQNYADNNLDEMLFTWWDAATQVSIRVRHNKTAAISATNPEYQGEFFVKTFSPISGQHGQLIETPVTFMPAGGITRDIVP